jgi:hypothetical protein
MIPPIWSGGKPLGIAVCSLRDTTEAYLRKIDLSQPSSRLVFVGLGLKFVLQSEYSDAWRQMFYCAPVRWQELRYPQSKFESISRSQLVAVKHQFVCQRHAEEDTIVSEDM